MLPVITGHNTTMGDAENIIPGGGKLPSNDKLTETRGITLVVERSNQATFEYCST